MIPQGLPSQLKHQCVEKVLDLLIRLQRCLHLIRRTGGPSATEPLLLRPADATRTSPNTERLAERCAACMLHLMKALKEGRKSNCLANRAPKCSANSPSAMKILTLAWAALQQLVAAQIRTALRH